MVLKCFDAELNSDDLLRSTVDAMKDEVTYLRQKLRDLDELRDRVRELEHARYNSDGNFHPTSNKYYGPAACSSNNSVSELQTLSPAMPSLTPKSARSYKPQKQPSELCSTNHTASPTTTTVSDRLRTGLIDNHDSSEDAATTFEFLALGGDHDDRETTNSPDGSRSKSIAPAGSSFGHMSLASPTQDKFKDPLLTPIPPNALSNLKSSGSSLTKEQSDSIIDFALDTLGWQHPVIHFTTFRAQASAYWKNILESSKVERDGGDGGVMVVNQAWFALYISLLSVGVHHMSVGHAARCNLSEGE